MNLKNVFIFALGAAVGSLVTWKLVDEKYKKIADEEIASMEEYYNNKLMSDVVETNIKLDSDGFEYDKKVEELNYTATAGLAEIVDDTEGIFINQNADIKENIRPYVISPEEFGEFGNAMRSLTYYSDFVLADEDDDIIIDPEHFVGDGLAHFGEYEDDCVHVRNENLETDFEILKSEKTFREINKEDD